MMKAGLLIAITSLLTACSSGSQPGPTIQPSPTLSQRALSGTFALVDEGIERAGTDEFIGWADPEDEEAWSAECAFDEEDVFTCPTFPSEPDYGFVFPSGMFPCTGTGGYSDIQPGLDVVVRNGEGDIIGAGQLEDDPAVTDLAEPIDRSYTCFYKFEVRDLPDVPFYVLEVGDRGEQTYSKADLEDDDWTLFMTLGR